ncbi:MULTISPECIES: RNA polymerase sigma factor [Maribacter]|uniref:Sigma-70 family RNA polymerase sigma factor n=1 Tax=Maribacter flavus TaxID=1658664 RepID=A0A5B2U1F6_9FLAO|nr:MULTISPECIES: sigma-70 family RNA polymerase sigma factor [Maribacter]KAA2219885.1 sigma-70 family RNA polymerase sigma factor [Maribacter flavus]MDC6405194.1 sigma-70 family RNA polymerase sigma factor [Maribacter sp. PR66]MEE1971997.1 sigma-70 family RNA polymerase sigma factor [Maribacter flavus]
MEKAEKIENIENLAEKEAWRDLRKGDINALGELYDLFVDKLFYIGMNIIRDREIVKDQIHDLFLDFYKTHKNLSDVNNIQGYIITCYKRRLYKENTLKVKHVNINWESKSNVFPNDLKLVSSHEDEIISSEIVNERNNKLAKKLSNLTEHQKNILEMRFTQNLSYEEIATCFNLSVSSARTLLYRTIKTLRNSAFTILF